MQLQKINAVDITLLPFQKLDKEWALLSAGDQSKMNAMTVSWGTLGTLWNKPITTVFVRPQRYTREFIEQQNYYSLSFLDIQYKKQLSYLGTVSGRDEDKIQKSGLTASYDSYAPFIEQASLVLICKKLYCDDIKPDNFICTEVKEQHYPLKDFHRFYIGEIVEAYTQQKP